MATKKVTITVKMLGAYGKYESGQEIELAEGEGAKLIALGYAKKIETPEAQAEE